MSSTHLTLADNSDGTCPIAPAKKRLRLMYWLNDLIGKSSTEAISQGSGRGLQIGSAALNRSLQISPLYVSYDKYISIVRRNQCNNTCLAFFPISYNMPRSCQSRSPWTAVSNRPSRCKTRYKYWTFAQISHSFLLSTNIHPRVDRKFGTSSTRYQCLVGCVARGGAQSDHPHLSHSVFYFHDLDMKPQNFSGYQSID